jgi:guanosine-3',5'-bis(diphosphate) 3'-pyrophosphohydrolase
MKKDASCHRQTDESLIEWAKRIATEAHENQTRKYTTTLPYIVHLFNVVHTVEHCYRPIMNGDEYQYAIATAYLHDTVEDTDITLLDIYTWGRCEAVTKGVYFLTDCDKSLGNRAFRKKIDCFRLGGAPYWVQTIKLADMLDNTHSIVPNDPKFAKTYLKEKDELLHYMQGGSPELRNRINNILIEHKDLWQN